MEPLTRSSLQSMKAEMLELQRKQNIKNIIINIYNQVKQEATNGKSSFTMIDDRGTYHNSKEEILQGLNSLFPDCNVSLKETVYLRKDRKEIDLSKIDKEIIPLLDIGHQRLTITVDWS